MVAIPPLFLLKTQLLIILMVSLLLLAPTPANSLSESTDSDSRLKQMELQIHQLNRKNVLSGLKNDQQDREIRFLKTLMSKMINNNKENKNTNEVANNDVPTMMQKRPARLLPFNLFRKKEGKPAIIVGPPSNCNDLNELGHTLNGIYLVSSKGSNDIKLNHSKLMTVNAIFCNFNDDEHPSSPIKESRLGFVNVKSSESEILFYVQIGNNLSFPANGVLRFDRQVINAGNGMNIKTGVFTAPKAGIYTFSFSILKNGYDFDYMFIHLRVNGAKKGHSGAGGGLSANSATMQSTLKLKKGDRVDLWKANGDLHHLCEYCHHFTGFLIEEDLMANF